MPMMRELIKIFGGRGSRKKNQSNDDINIFSTNCKKLVQIKMNHCLKQIFYIKVRKIEGPKTEL